MKTCWYAAYTGSCQERKVSEALSALGVEHFLPIQKVLVQYSDRKKLVDRLVLPHMIFIKTDEQTRIKLLGDIYGLRSYMTCGGTYHPVIIPDNQMDDFRFMVTRSREKVALADRPLAPGDRVRVINGPLSGLEAELVEVNGEKTISVKMGFLGTAYASISPDSVEKII
ncbi:MAG: UpxY family transcription antiterminator [Bacteroidales bacterium]|nr:UpxY family transcription antiterminator [Bacteroidales bacterium]